MTQTVTLIPGDGIGPELADAARRVIDATGADLEWEVVEAGEAAWKSYGEPLPRETLDSFERNKVMLKSPITTPVGGGFRSVTVALRQKFDMYACIRPCKMHEGVSTICSDLDIDIVVIRENIEDLYVGIEFPRGSEGATTIIELAHEKDAIPPFGRIAEDSGISIKAISESETRRIAEFAFKYAKEKKREKITVVHKGNNLKFTDGLFLEVAKDVARNFPTIKFEDRIVDNMCMQLVQKPEQYDILLLPNLYGDIISDLIAGLVGGLGVAPCTNIGDDFAMFEATHGTAPKYAGLNKVNPTGLILAGAMMLKHIGERKAAECIEKAVWSVIREGKYVTHDLKKKGDDSSAVGTSEMAYEIISKVKSLCS